MPPKIRVLVVDDHLDAADTLAELLRLDGYEVDTALDGRAALDMAGATHYDCVLTDINMPGMDGADLAAALRERFGGDMVLVAITGHGDNSLRVQKAIQNTDHFFTKPVKAADLKKVFKASA